MAKDKKKGVHIVSKTGSPMMTLEAVGREGDSLTMQGALMGSWSSKMYLAPEELLPMLGLLLRWELMGYVFSLPFILIRRGNKKSEKK